MQRPRFLAALAVAALVPATAACDTGDGKALRPPTSDERRTMPTTTTTTITSFASTPLGSAPGLGALPGASPTSSVAGAFTLAVPWANGGLIDARFTCDGANLSPLLTWTAPPAGTVELALLVTDVDADGFVHWAVAGIPPTAGEKGEGATVTGALEGRNDAGTTGWSGPCPPAGETHTYRFTMYALGQQAELPDGFTGADLLAVAGPGSTGMAELTGTYTRAA